MKVKVLRFILHTHACIYIYMYLSVQFSSVQSLSCVRLFATPWTAAHQASLSITNSQSLLKFMSIELVMPSNHLILCHPLLLPPLVFLSIRVFSNESVLCISWPKYCVHKSIYLFVYTCLLSVLKGMGLQRGWMLNALSLELFYNERNGE